MLNVCFVGVGSIAGRHIINLARICKKRNVILNLDIYRSGKGVPLSDQLMEVTRKIYDISALIMEKYDAVFVTNPTSMHYDTILRFQEHTKAFFIEKPVFDTFDKDLSKIDQNRIYYVACPLRYKALIQHLKKNIDVDKVYSVRAISSSYLPDWRPGIDYKTTYSAHKELGGGVSIDLIHEWDYLTYLFGPPKKIFTIQKKISHLDIDSEDAALYIADCGNTLIELHLDYFGRKPIRQIEIFAENETIVCDLIENEMMRTGPDGEKRIQFQEERDDYQIHELEYFLDLINSNAESENDITHACNILKLSKGEIE